MPKKHNADATSAHKTLTLFALLLFSGKRHYLADLAVRLECSKATVLRLMRGIESAEIVAIETGITDRKRWYQLATPPSGRPCINLSHDEVEKLALCRDLLECLLPDSIERIVSNGLEKVSLLMDKAEERATATAPKAVRMVRGFIDYTPHQEHIDCLLKAITAQSVCAITYTAPGKTQRVFEVVPMRLMADGDVLNVEGWRVTDKGTPKARFPTTLAVHRIQACIPTRRRMETCPPLPELQGAFGIVGDEPFRVTVMFSNEWSAHIRERIWSADQSITDLPDGGVKLAFTATSEEQVIAWVLSFGDGAELVEPISIRTALKRQVESLLTMYVEEGKADSTRKTANGR